MSEITKAELGAMIEVQSKTAQQLERIANSLGAIADDQKEIVTCMSNCQGIKEKVSKIKDDMFWLKVVYGSIGFVAMIVIVIIKALKL